MVHSPTETELAWAAGFFDGEGTVGLYKVTQYHSGKPYFGWRLSARLSGCHRASVEKFAAIIGFGTIKMQRRTTRTGKSIWNWQAFNSHVLKSLVPLLPYLVIKADQVRLAVSYRDSVGNFGSGGKPPDLVKKHLDMADRMKFLKTVLN